MPSMTAHLQLHSKSHSITALWYWGWLVKQQRTALQCIRSPVQILAGDRKN